MICAGCARFVDLVTKPTVSAAECDRHSFPGRVPSAKGGIPPFPLLKMEVGNLRASATYVWLMTFKSPVVVVSVVRIGSGHELFRTS